MLTFGGNLLMAQGLVLSVFKMITESEMGASSLYELKRLLEAPEVKDPGDASAIPSGEVAFFDQVTFVYGREAARSARLKRLSARAAAAKISGPPAETNGRDASNDSAVQPRPVLNHVSFRIAPGTFAAIVGQSGSGKTTLFHMLLRLLEPHDGDILLGGLPLGAIPLKALRNFIGFIPQSPFIFSGSIRENLLMGASESDVPCARIEHAVEMSKLGDLIVKRRKAGGLDAPVGAGGASLSAGERQRIALARVFLRDPGIIVCDEYTANIDNATARLIQGALKSEFSGKTRIVITHQLYTVRGADCIYVLDDGQIVDHGTHDSLMNKEGLYREMWEVQRV